MTHEHEGWKAARPIDEFHKLHKGERYADYMQQLHVVDVHQAAYGDWTLYVDDTGNYWESYFSLGD